MGQGYIVDKRFEVIDFSLAEPLAGEYEHCIFERCIFAGVKLTDVSFVDCTFLSCDFSLAKIINTGFRDVKFAECKLVGVMFEGCNTFSLAMKFEHCQLNLSSFYKLNLRNSQFSHCALREVDFSEADLTAMHFNNCDLSGAIFSNTCLAKSDFRSAVNYGFDPALNNIKGARFSIQGLPGLLQKFGIIVEL